MKITKRIAAFGAAMVMAVSMMSMGASATTSASDSTSRTNTSYTKSISATYNSTNTTLSVGYYYGGTKSGKSDMLCTYGYNNVLGYKYASINYAGSTYTSSGKTNATTNQISKAKLSTTDSSAIVYSGYVKADKSDTVKKYKMKYTLTLN